MSLHAFGRFLFVITGAVIWGHWWRRKQVFTRSKGFSLPPGPPRKPVIGNKRKYGNVVYAEVLGNGILLLNSIESSFSTLQWSPVWKQHRKLTHLSLSPEAVKKYYTVQEDITAMYLDSLIEHPEDFVAQLRLTAGRIIMSVTYGLPVKSSDDNYITEAEATMEMVGKAIVPGAFLVDIIHILRYLPSWLPFNTIHKTALAGRKQIETTVSRPLEHVMSELKEGTARPLFTLECLEIAQSQDISDQVTHWSAGTMYAAGSETTYTTVLSFILAMAKYPEVQVKIKEEFDRVVGSGRLPSMQDRPSLPYVNAAIKETTRWRVALPLSIARRTREDDFYEGYYIPKGTIVLPNVWAISQDERSGIPSQDFSPERFLNTHVKETATDPYSYAFGFGRRVCPGKALGDNSLFIIISSLMATMDISWPNGEPDPTFTAGLISYSEPFKATIFPRSSEARELIKEKVSRVM